MIETIMSPSAVNVSYIFFILNLTIEELLAQSICINGLLEISLLEQKFSGVCKSERAFICWCLELYESSLLMMISGQEHLYIAKRV